MLGSPCQDILIETVVDVRLGAVWWVTSTDRESFGEAVVCTVGTVRLAED